MTPPYALACWADDTYFYMQVPNPKGEPVTITFNLASGGLARALPYLRSSFKTAPRPTVIPNRLNNEASDKARSVLRRLGMMG